MVGCSFAGIVIKPQLTKSHPANASKTKTLSYDWSMVAHLSYNKQTLSIEMRREEGSVSFFQFVMVRTPSCAPSRIDSAIPEWQPPCGLFSFHPVAHAANDAAGGQAFLCAISSVMTCSYVRRRKFHSVTYLMFSLIVGLRYCSSHLNVLLFCLRL